MAENIETQAAGLLDAALLIDLHRLKEFFHAASVCYESTQELSTTRVSKARRQCKIIKFYRSGTTSTTTSMQKGSVALAANEKRLGENSRSMY